MERSKLPRRYTDEEVQGLIRRALAMQERSNVPAPHGGHAEGLTLADVRQIAAEVGIDPRFVELAAVAGDDGETARGRHPLAGAPFRWRVRRAVVGEIADEDRGRLLEAIRAGLGHPGEVDDVFGAMEVSHNDGLGPIVVGVRSRDGRTEIDVAANRSGGVGMLYGLTIGVGGVALGALGAILAGALGLTGPVVLPFVLAGTGVAYVGSRVVWRFRSRAWERRLEALAHRVADAAATVGRLPAAEGEPREGDSP